MFYTTFVAALTAATNLGIIFCMNSYGLDRGLGLAAIGIVTFFGVSLSSSIFEKYKDKPKSETKLNDNLISRIVIGKGIMRKGLAASLIMTYIVLIGLSFSAGTLDNSLGTENETEKISGNGKTPTDETSLGSNNANVATTLKNIGITNIQDYDKIKVITNQTSKSLEELILEKEPDTLVQHFTIVISVIIGFYFGSNTLAALLKARKEDKPIDNSSEILKVRLIKGEIEEEEYKKLKDLIKE